MGFGLSSLNPFHNPVHDAISGALHGDPPKPPGLGGHAPWSSSSDSGLGSFPGLPFHLQLPFQQDTAPQGPSAEERLESFKDDKGQPLWKTDAQKQALLKILQQDPSMTVEKFKRGQEMALLSGVVYYDANNPNIPSDKRTPPAGYERVSAETLGLKPEQLIDPTTGLHAEVFKDTRTGTYTLAFRGTDSIKDWKNANIQAFDPKAPQYEQAIQLAKTLQATLGDKFTDITGQSMGGGLAAAASAMTGVRATTFNASGLNPDTVTVHGGTWDEERMKSLITNYRVAGDPLTESQEGSGTDPLSGYVASHWGGWGAHLIGELGHQMGEHLGSPVQNSYITGPNAQILPDAVGTQVTLIAFSEQDGHALSRDEQMNSANWDWLHNFGAIGAGLLIDPELNHGPIHSNG